MGSQLDTESIDSVRKMLARHGQEHVLAHVARLNDADVHHLLQQIESIDFEELDGLIRTMVLAKPEKTSPQSIEPAPFYAVGQYDSGQFGRTGEEVIRRGEVAAFTVAGGQGTRLGWNGPKGTFPATVVTGKPLFRVFAEQIVASQRKYGVTIPWYIMTSPLNDADTRRFFADNNWFGLQARDVFMFEQGVMPSVDFKGKLLLEGLGTIAFNPDGHGGSIKALAASGALDDMRSRRVTQISYFQVDNPLARVIDPVFIGLHVGTKDSSGEMSSKMVAKASAEEKVGVFCRSEGKTRVVEYSDLPVELAEARDANGELRFVAGSIAIHLVSVDFVHRLTSDRGRFGLPYHKAEKKVAYVNEAGVKMEPSQVNAVKFETFVFDALSLASASIVMETLRVEEFAPIKNASGSDSPATSHQMQSDRHGGWLQSNGVRIPRKADGRVDAKIEISPLTASSPTDLERVALPGMVASGSELLL